MTIKGLGRGLGSLIPSRPTTTNEPSLTSVLSSGAGVRYVPVETIKPNPHQPREHFAHTAMEELVASVKAHGVLQPLLVTETPEGIYELVAGERRLRAATMAGLPTVPVLIKSAKDVQKLELALIENIQRQDLNPIEEARAYQRLSDEFGLTQEEISRRVGKSRSVVANLLRLLALPEAVQYAIRDGKISSSAARTIASFETPDDQLKAFASATAEKLTVRDLESRLQRHVPASRGRRALKDPDLEAAEDELQQALGTKVQIKKRGASGRIEIAFYSEEELAELRRKLMK